MAQFPALPLWTDAYLADTMHLTNEEHGAYLRLLMIMWRSPNCEVKYDVRRISTMLGITTKKWAKLWDVLEPFFTIEDDFLRQKKLTKVRQEVEKNVEQKRLAGEASAKAKALKNKKTGLTAVSTASQRQINEPKPKPKQVSKNGKNHSSQESEFLNSKNGKNDRVLLHHDTYEEAKEFSAGWDIYYLEKQFNEFNRGKVVKDPDRAFIGFIKTHVARNGRA